MLFLQKLFARWLRGVCVCVCGCGCAKFAKFIETRGGGELVVALTLSERRALRRSRRQFDLRARARVLRMFGASALEVGARAFDAKFVTRHG